MSGERIPDLRKWLGRRGLDTHWAQLDAHEVDLEAFFDLEYAHLKEMGFAVGARLKLLKALSEHKGRSSRAAGAKVAVSHGRSAERRQITAMFCDIVGYTNLSSRIDPEETRRLLHGYWQRIEDTTSAFDGHIAQYLGDGALIYFGYPNAGEDDAERAVKAALTLLGSLADAGRTDSAKLHIRIGIATGLVVVGDDLGRGDAARGTLAVGPTVNLASRLQALAQPGHVVVDESTRVIVGERFAFEPLARVEIAGLDTQSAIFTVIGVKNVRTRFEARSARAAAEIVGRTSELAAGLNLWRRVLDRKGQMLIVEGEPGIGKSHLAWQLARIIADDGFEVLPFQCSPHHADSPFYPLIEGLSAMAGIVPADTEADRMSKFEALFSLQRVATGDTTFLLASIVGAAFQQPVEAGPDNPTLRRQRTFAALTSFFAERARTRPFLIVIEDIHWCDPTTLEVLARLMGEIDELPIMMLATARPSDNRLLGEAPQLSRMTLSRLSQSETQELVLKIFGAHAVSGETLDFINARTDGVPLFIEELARTVREAGLPLSPAAGQAINEGRDLETIPNSLQGILMERLDTLKSAKRIAQIAACIGRVFDASLLASIVDIDDTELAEALNTLTASEMIRGTPGSAEFRFRHALVCDAAYSSLLLTERKTIHGIIAASLASQPAPARAEILAYHLTQAHEIVPAIEKWQEAAIAAKLRSANVEAIAHIGKAMGLLAQLQSTDERKAREFALLIELIAPFRATKGFAAREVAEVTERAILLADEARDVRGVLPLLYNQWVYKFVTAHRDVCQQFAEEILARCAYDEDDLLRMTGLRAMAVTNFTRGRFEEAVAGFAASIALYAPERQAAAIQSVGLDALVVACGYNSLACWCLGRTDDAVASIERALRHARKLEHASTTMFAIYHQTLLKGVLVRNVAVLRDNGATLEAIGTQQHFDMWAVCGRLLRAMGDCLATPSPRLVHTVVELLADYKDMGVVYRPTYEVFIAEAWLRLGDRKRGLEHIGRAHTLMEVSGERWNEAEMLRVEGELLLLRTADAGKAEQALLQAVAIAQAQGASPFEARARQALARLLPQKPRQGAVT